MLVLVLCILCKSSWDNHPNTYRSVLCGTKQILELSLLIDKCMYSTVLFYLHLPRFFFTHQCFPYAALLYITVEYKVCKKLELTLIETLCVINSLLKALMHLQTDFISTG